MAEAGHRPKHLSYPYGRCNPEVQSLAKELDLASAVMTEPAELVTVESMKYGLTRIESPRSMSLFRFWTSGAYPGLTIALLGRR